MAVIIGSSVGTTKKISKRCLAQTYKNEKKNIVTSGSKKTKADL